MRAVLLLAIGLSAACGCDAPRDELVDAAPTTASDSAPRDADCQACHVEAAAQWARSRHHGAFTNPDFARAYAREPRPFCRNCHAPALTRAESLRLPDHAAEQLGVGCIDCHVDPERPDAVLAGPTPRSCAGGECVAPHAVLATDEFGTHSCARCHEFEFPPESRRPPGLLMQTTMREHQASAHADRACADCHLPRVGAGALEYRDHALASTRSDASMRAALAITARREGDTLIVELEPRGVGHAFPTGDLFRRVEIHARLWQGDALLATARRYLDREFPAWRLPNGRRNPSWDLPLVDDRVHGSTTITLELAHAHGDAETEIEWWVDYERVDERDHLDPSRSTLADELRLAEGRL